VSSPFRPDSPSDHDAHQTSPQPPEPPGGRVAGRLEDGDQRRSAAVIFLWLLKGWAYGEPQVPEGVYYCSGLWDSASG
jgi:hypothetical protein